MDATLYSEIRDDRKTLMQAIILAVFTSLFTGIGSSGGYTEKIPSLSLLAFMGWISWVLLIYIADRKCPPKPDLKTDLSTIFRVMGFAFLPGLFKALAFLPAFSYIILFGTTIWIIAGSVIATQQVFHYRSMRRIILTNLVGWMCYQWILSQA